MNSPQEHLTKARDLLEKSDWIQGRMKEHEPFEEGKDGYCAAGALGYANELLIEDGYGEVYWIGGNNEAEQNIPALRLLNEVAREQYPDRTIDDPGRWGIVDLNDARDTTREDIMRIYDKAIVRAGEEV